MHRCFQLAACGSGNTAPNPLVGAVITHNERIIGEGYHRKYGEPHAEVNAVASVQEPELLTSSTLYVNLEPCAHHGKTPPCADLIIEKGIPRVVIANRDPFPAVDGKGIEKLKATGVEVITGVASEEGRHLNRHFFTFHEQRRPYITLKWAQTANGFIDRARAEGDKGPAWITEPETRKLVHLWRTHHRAILIGSKTALNDDPELTARDVLGPQPLRVVLDPDGEAQLHGLRVYNDAAPTLYFGQKWPDASVECIEADRSEILEVVLQTLFERKVLSVLVEGGKFTLERFIELGLWDEARVLSGQTMFASGAFAPKINAAPAEAYTFGGDRINIFYR